MPDLTELLREAAGDAAPAPVDAIAGRARRRQRAARRRAQAAVAGASLVLLAGGTLLATTREEPDARVVTSTPELPSERVLPYHGDVAIDGDEVWIADNVPVIGAVHRVDRETLELVATIDLPSMEDTHMIDVGPSGVWAGTSGYGEQISGGGVVRIDPDTNEVTAHLDAEGLGRWDPTDLVVTADVVWVSDGLGQRLLLVDPETAKVVMTIPGFASQLSAGDGVVWATGERTVAFDASTGALLAELPVVATSIAATEGGGVWLVADGRLEHHTIEGARRTFDAVDELTRLAADGDRVWIADVGGFRQIDERGRAVPRTQRTSQAVGGWNVTAADGEVWRSDGAQTTRWRP